MPTLCTRCMPAADVEKEVIMALSKLTFDDANLRTDTIQQHHLAQSIHTEKHVHVHTHTHTHSSHVFSRVVTVNIS